LIFAIKSFDIFMLQVTRIWTQQKVSGKGRLRVLTRTSANIRRPALGFFPELCAIPRLERPHRLFEPRQVTRHRHHKAIGTVLGLADGIIGRTLLATLIDQPSLQTATASAEATE
jgi:hypothetical protein